MEVGMLQTIQEIVFTREHSPRRGGGMLEPFLARGRAVQAYQLIPASHRSGRMLDIGCASYPYFLSHNSFVEKFAAGPVGGQKAPEDIRWQRLNLNSGPALPFEKEDFDVITLLAVVKRLDRNSLVALFQECQRVLRPGGMVVLTNPAARSENVLRWMAKLNLVKAKESEECVYAYTLPQIEWYFGKAGFEREKVRSGYFEGGFNVWACAVK
jgi:SAM-dependent methyltransferase